MKRIWVIYVVLFLCACQTKHSLQAKNDDRDSIHMIFKDSLQNELFWRRFRYENAQLNLPLLDKGTDSFELRIWHSGIITEHDLYIATINEWGLTVTKTIYTMRAPRSGDASYDSLYKFPGSEFSLIDSFQTKRAFSKRDAGSFLDSIYSYHFDTIPSQSMIPGFKDRVADGTGFVIEIAWKDHYKILEYHCPDFYSKRGEINNQKIVSLLKFIELYLHVSFSWCYL